jgi:hypothetical protein
VLRLRDSKFFPIHEGLGWRNPQGLILRSVDAEEPKKQKEELHEGLCGGHYEMRTPIHKILRAN